MPLPTICEPVGLRDIAKALDGYERGDFSGMDLLHPPPRLLPEK